MIFSFAFSANLKSIPAPFSRGVNFSSWMEFKNPGEINVNFFTKEDFENVKKMGCDIVRLPVHFEQLSHGRPDYEVDSIVWHILDNVTAWANELKLYVIIDFHNNTAGGTSTPKNIEEILLKIWNQISSRYSNSGKYICYEIYNEPHGINIIQWGKIEEKIINKIRENDKSHYIICGGADWNSFDALKALPDFTDEKLIYTFHFYEPFLFTHQGANWNDLKRIKNIPFPYDKNRMPSLPENATSKEKWYLSSDYNYSLKGTEKSVSDFFDQYVDFSLKRNAPVYCGEFGVYMPYADPKERTNWYRIVTNLLDEKGIAHTSWDYYGSFGVFKSETETLFPQDLNRDVVEAMKLKVPEGKSLSWFKYASSNNNYSIYENGFSNKLSINSWDSKYSLTEKIDSDNYCMKISQMNPWGAINISFREIVDFSKLATNGYKLEFLAKNTNQNLHLQIWFQDSETVSEYEWRASKDITSAKIPNDGNWHKISIPLSEFLDVGAWSNKSSSWVNSKKSFSWANVDRLVISNADIALNNDLLIKDIKISN